jgi:hypothetical protein
LTPTATNVKVVSTVGLLVAKSFLIASTAPIGL